MDKQNTDSQNRNPLWADEPIIIGDSEKVKKFFKALAVLVVFLVSLSLPLYFSMRTQGKAKEIVVKMDMDQLKNWAEVYKIQNGSYTGLEDDSEIEKVFENIKSMGGNPRMIINRNSSKYCCQTEFIKKDLGTWCVDYSGYVGKDSNCNLNNISCK